MKNQLLFLLVVLTLGYLLVCFLRSKQPVPKESETETDLSLPESPGFKNRLRFLQTKTDSMKNTIDRLTTKCQRTKDQLVSQSEKSTQKIAKVKAMPADQQAEVFENWTGESLDLDISQDDTTAQISIEQLREANLQFFRLDTLTARDSLLEARLKNQDSLLILQSDRSALLALHTKLLTQQSDILKELLQQKELALKKERRAHRLERIGAGILIAAIWVLAL